MAEIFLNRKHLCRYRSSSEGLEKVIDIFTTGCISDFEKNAEMDTSAQLDSTMQ